MACGGCCVASLCKLLRVHSCAAQKVLADIKALKKEEHSDGEDGRGEERKGAEVMMEEVKPEGR